MRKTWWLLVVPVLLAGCATVGYYNQAAQGHLALMASARPIEDWVADPATPQALRERLLRAQEIRRFAAESLGLPDNGSYTSYADLQRPAAVWNVFATPELSLQLKTWCYPVLGCASYRGYFDRADAEKMAADLQAAGYDVNVAAVPAYSTLGWFDDPLLNTFIHAPEVELARLVFHELSHQVVYVRDDTVFNESFATAVEREGVRRWLAAHGDDRQRAAWVAYSGRREDFLALLRTHRRQLGEIFASAATVEEKRAAKAAVFDKLQRQYRQLRSERWNGFAGYDRFFERKLSSAHLAAVGAYNDRVPSFEALLAESGGDLPAFYARVRQLGALEPARRTAELNRLAPQVAQTD
ncbi:MAG: aminopeptidase [Burkholderiales bacterium]|nr:aminopeptidase [Burkholderiales bacterium]